MTDLNLPSGSRQARLLLDPFNINYTVILNFNPQYKVIGPYNYDRIMHNIEKICAKRQDIGQTNGKMH